jgi:hypothetical protein
MSPAHALILLLLLRSGIHPNPGPPSSSQQSDFTFLQLNINGIRKSTTELSNFLNQQSVKVACLQETKLSGKAKTPSISNYAFVRKDRPVGNGGGLAILIHNSVPFTNIDTSHFSAHDPTLELLAICVDVGGSQLDIFNIYVPPASANAGYAPDFINLFNQSNNDTLLLGDFNAHHPEWCASLSDARGDSLTAAADSCDLCVLNTNLPTCLPCAGNQALSSPDVSLISSHLVPSVTWSTHTTLNSDHLPITVIFRTNASPPRSKRTFSNFLKADWAGFVRETE